MPKDYYEDSGEAPEAEEVAMGGEETQSPSGGKTALIPKSLLGGKEFKVGDEVVLKITHEYEDEVAVEYAPEKPAEEEEEEGESELPNLPGREEFDQADKEAAYA